MAKTRQDLVKQALADLGILAAGQNPSAEDFDAVNGYVTPLVAWLESTEIYDFDDIDEHGVPDDVFRWIALILADDAAIEFGLPGVPPKPGDPTPPRQKAIDNIRLVTYGRPTYQAQRTEYF